MTVLETLRQNAEQQDRAANTGGPKERMHAPLAVEQYAAYASVRRLLDHQFEAFLDQSATVDERLDAMMHRGHAPHILEVMRSEDAASVFKKVVTDMLIEPDEPNLVFTTIFPSARIDGQLGNVFEVLLTDAIEAQQVHEGQPLGDSSIDLSKARQEVRVVKFGVQIGITEETLKQNQWDVLGLHIRAAANALARRKEQYGFTILQNNATVVFDNTTPTASLLGATHGVGSDGTTANYTITHLDFVDLIAGLVNRQHTPTDVFYHPLAWSGLLKDPLVSRLVSGQGAGYVARPMALPTPSPMDVKLPFEMVPHMVPWINSNISTKAASDAYRTDLLVCDRGRSAILLQKDDPTPSEWFEPSIDVIRKKWIESYGVAMTHAGSGVAVARGVVADANYAPYPIVRTVTAAP